MSWYGRDLENAMGQGIKGASYDTGSLFYRRYTEIVDFTLESDASIIQPDEHMSRPVTQMFCRASNTNGEQNVLWNLRDYLEKLAESGLQLGKVETLSLKCGSHKREWDIVDKGDVKKPTAYFSAAPTDYLLQIVQLHLSPPRPILPFYESQRLHLRKLWVYSLLKALWSSRSREKDTGGSAMLSPKPAGMIQKILVEL